MGSFSAEQLRILASAYVAATGMALSTLGQKAGINHAVFVRLVAGQGCTLENGEKASRWFIENWPKTVPWPEDVPLKLAVSRSRHQPSFQERA